MERKKSEAPNRLVCLLPGFSGDEVGLAETEAAVVLRVVSWLETVLNEPQFEEMTRVVAEGFEEVSWVFVVDRG